MKLTDYSFYKTNYGGELIPTDIIFCRICLKASNFIRKVTFNRIKKDNISDEVQFAVCSVADELYSIEKVGLKTTETVGNHTISYVQLTENELNKKIYSIAKTYLPDELLYRGIY